MPRAIGMIEVEGVAGIIDAADAAAKAATVELLGWESIGGFTTLFVRGDTADVDTALAAGAAAAHTVNGHVVTAPLHQPLPETEQFIGFPLPEAPAQVVAPGALGLIETRGYGAHVAVNDRMVKAADVHIARVLTVHNRVVCTLVTGSIDDVETAVDEARQELAASQWLMGTAVIQQPLPEVLRAFAESATAGGAS
jgi:ethanolamine utilization protein EutM